MYINIPYEYTVYTGMNWDMSYKSTSSMLLNLRHIFPSPRHTLHAVSVVFPVLCWAPSRRLLSVFSSPCRRLASVCFAGGAQKATRVRVAASPLLFSRAQKN